LWFVGGCIWLMAPKESVNGLACAKAKRWDAPSCLAISGGWVSGSSYLYVGFLFHASFFSLTSSLISLKLSYTIVASLCCNFPSGSNIPTVRSLCHFYQFSCCLQLPVQVTVLGACPLRVVWQVQFLLLMLCACWRPLSLYGALSSAASRATRSDGW
jgi:hypothetical protein